MKFYYTVPEDDEDTFYELHTNHYCLEYVAEGAAEDYFYNHDGVENSWPLDIVLYDEKGGEPIAKFEVDREDRPVFYAIQL